MDDPLCEGDSQVEPEVLNEDSEAAGVPPHPGDAPAVGRGELDDVPEDGGVDSHSDRVRDVETHLHLLAQLHTKQYKKIGLLTASARGRPWYMSCSGGHRRS